MEVGATNYTFWWLYKGSSIPEAGVCSAGRQQQWRLSVDGEIVIRCTFTIGKGDDRVTKRSEWSSGRMTDVTTSGYRRTPATSMDTMHTGFSVATGFCSPAEGCRVAKASPSRGLTRVAPSGS